MFTRRVGSSPTDRTIDYLRAGSPTIIESRGRGGMADALASGASDGNIVEVQVLSTAPYPLFNFISHHAVVAELADALS